MIWWLILFSPILIFLYVAYLMLKALWVILVMLSQLLDHKQPQQLGYIDESGKVRW